MKVIVNKHDLRIIKDEDINEKESNIQKIEFEFSKEYDGFQKYALFTDLDNKTEKIIIDNDVIEMPYFEKKQRVILGVYAEKIIDDKLYRLNPTPKIFYIEKGSLRDAENHKEITPSEFEQYMQLMNNALEDIPNKIKEKIDSYDFENINLDKYVKKENGKGLSSNDFTNIDKTKLDNLNNYDDTSIKKDLEVLNKKIEEAEKTPGPQGPKGDPFTFEDFTEEQLNLLKGPQGEQGIQGETGPKGEIGPQGPPGINGQDGYTPVVGVDYSSKQEIQEYCRNYIDENYLSLLEEGF